MELSFKTNLTNKVVIITGGAGVLCSTFARAIAMCGAKVAILDLNLEKAEEVASSIKKDGYEAHAFKCNVLEKESIEAAYNDIKNLYGTCDILINGAGGNSPKATTDDEFFDESVMNDLEKKSFFDLDLNGFNFVFGLNFTGTLLPTQIIAKDMINKENASIINISSMNSFTPLTKIPAYSAAKAAISNFTKWLAVYFSKVNIRVNAIAPGFFSTEQNAKLLWNVDGTPTARTKKILNNTPMGRFGESEELLGTLIWLLDKSSSFITGIVVPVDGGFSAYSGV